MNFKHNTSRRDALKTATALALAGGLPTLETLHRIAHAAGGTGQASVADDYKAIVCVFLYGGQDHANIVIPCQDGAGAAPAATHVEYDRYAAARSNSNNIAGGDPADQSLTTGNLAHTRAQLDATLLSSTTGAAPVINTLSGTASPTTGGWTTNTFGRQFALNPDMLELRNLYQSGKLAIMANVGPMLAPISRHQWYTNTGGRRPLNLYSHDDQQRAWMSATADVANPTVGIGGRIASTSVISGLNRFGALESKVATQVSLNGSNAFMLTDSVSPVASAVAYQMGNGRQGRQTSATVCDVNNTNTALPLCLRGGPIPIGRYADGSTIGYASNATLMAAVNARFSATAENVSIYHDQWRGIADQSVQAERAITTAFLAAPPTEDILTPFSASSVDITRNQLAQQLRMVAAMIRASNELGPQSGIPMKRQIFFVGIGGFDTHDDFWKNNRPLNRQISTALNAFWTALGNIQVVGGAAGSSAQDKVTTFTMSEFGRTLDSNGRGSDHGWGNFQFVLGGAVNGRHIYGQDHNVSTVPTGSTTYMQLDSTAGAMPRIGIAPNSGSVRIANQLNHSLGRGEMLPTMASDAMMATITKWFGVPITELTGAGKVFPTLQNVHGSNWDVGFMKPA